MPAIVILGAQWGDEGKGKATDLLATSTTVDYCVRHSQRRPRRGSHHARRQRREVRDAPVAERDPHAGLYLGPWPTASSSHLRHSSARSNRLEARGVDTSTLVVSAMAIVIASYRTRRSTRWPSFLGKNKIGERRDRSRDVSGVRRQDQPRTGIRIADLFEQVDPAPEGRGRPRREEPPAGQGLQPISTRTRSSRSCCRTPTAFARWSRTPAPCSTRPWTKGKPVLFEGAEGTLLDVDHGTYPFVTSSSRRAACAGAGWPDRSTGSSASRRTRRGSATAVPDRVQRGRRRPAERIGREDGTSTGRPRAVGGSTLWCRYSSRVNGLTDYYLTKLDILSHWEQIPVCVAYDIDGHAARRDP